jgi:cellulose synthase operon protein C
MSSRKLLFAALLFTAGVSATLACGPFFPWQLLDDRTATLRATPNNSFVFEASHFVTPSDRLKANEPDEYNSEGDRVATQAHFESQGLSSGQAQELRTVRSSAGGDPAYAMGADLPPAIRLYAVGAADFHMSNLAPAAQRFQAVLALPAKDRAARAVWAGYMLGKTEALVGDNAKADEAFEATRKLAIGGLPDPLGLAVASYGEQAKSHYDRAIGVFTPTPPIIAEGSQTNTPSTNNAPPGSAALFGSDPGLGSYQLPGDGAATYRNEMAAAAALYAEQAARGSDSGVQSLRMIAEGALSSPDAAAAAVQSPLLERLLVDYALARIDDEPAQDQGVHDAGTGEKGIKINARLPMLVAAIEKNAGPNPAGADRLAALCYRTGRYDLAATLASKSDSPMAEWVKAKLALQKGDVAGAAVHYAKASKGFPQGGAVGSLDDTNSHLVVGEMGTLSLSRGEYLDALNTLYPVAGTYWGDVSYIAERVLTTDELKNFVDTKVPASTQKHTDTPGYYGQAADPASQLRDLLARRLMRDGRFDEALPYFSDPKTQAAAQVYAGSLHDGAHDWGRVDRAQALFAAAVLARSSGMEILGTEGGPDYASLAGNYNCCVGQDDPKGAYVTPGEKGQAAASKAWPNSRFHYRYIAADEASRAADLLPPRSQAYAAVLCKATGWMLQTDEKARAHALYVRYVKTGARVPFAKTFGEKCPDPDFAGAVTLERHQLYRHWRHFVSVHRWWILGIGLAGLAALAFGIFAAVKAGMFSR